MTMTRTSCRETCCGRLSAKERKHHYSHIQAELKRPGRHVEVFVASQRDWYVGTIENDHPGEENSSWKYAQLVSVRFKNGAVLNNVRPNELRSVPRTTFVGWFLFALFVAVELAGIFLAFSVITHNLDPANRNRVWMFPDYENVPLGDGHGGPTASLYNLTYDQVAAADASPKTWLRLTWSMLHHSRSLPKRGENETFLPQEFRQWKMGADDHNYTHGKLSCQSFPRLHPNFYRIMEQKVFSSLNFQKIHYLPLYSLLMSSLELRRVPLYVQLTVVILSSSVNFMFGVFCLSIPGTPTEALRGNVIKSISKETYRALTPVAIMWFVLPVVSAMLQKQRLTKQVVPKLMTMFLVTAAAAGIVFARLINGWFALYKVLDSDYGLEGVAAAVTYLLSTAVDLDHVPFILIPLLLSVGVLTLQSDEHGITVGSVRIITITAVVLGTFIAIVYLVAEPFAVVDPVNWRFLFAVSPFSEVPTKFFGHGYIQRDRVSAEAFMCTFLLILCLIGFRPIVQLTLQKINVATRVRRLAAGTRHALTSEIVSSSIASPSADTDDYQPLNRRPASESVIRPLAKYFEKQFAQPDARLESLAHAPTFIVPPMLSMSVQVKHLLSVTGVTLAGYMANVVSGAGAGEHDSLFRTLEAFLDDVSCSVNDRRFILDLANREIPSSAVTPEGSHSSLARLRDVVRRLGTKHRDTIYLRRMHIVAISPGFHEFVQDADRIQAMAAEALGGQVVRQSCVPEGIPWADGAIMLLDSGCGVRDRYNDFMAILMQKSGADAYYPAPMKGLFRLSEKLWLRPTEGQHFRRGDCSNVFDIVRGMLVCDTMGELSTVLRLFVACDVDLYHELRRVDRGESVVDHSELTAAQAAGITERINVVRVKNRFRHPTPSGWADVLINFTFVSDPGQHICEVQLVHEDMLTARMHCNAHAAYAKFRSALELLETFGLMAPGADTASEAFVQELDEDYAEFMTRYQQQIQIAPVPVSGATGDSSAEEEQDRAVEHTDTVLLSDLQEEVLRLRHENVEQRKEFQRLQEQHNEAQAQFQAKQADFQQQLEKIRLQIQKS